MKIFDLKTKIRFFKYDFQKRGVMIAPGFIIHEKCPTTQSLPLMNDLSCSPIKIIYHLHSH